MYVQITTRCNMTCSHCCFACTNKGVDMTFENFKKAIAIAKEHDQMITIGGGEPTIHPQFQEFLMYAVWELASVTENNGNPAVGLVTNGSMTETAINLAKLAKNGVIWARVSKDPYHDPIDERVFKAFERPKRDYYSTPSARDERDCRDIGGANGLIQRMGRAKSWGNRSQKDGCCGGLFIHPSGKIYPCDCRQKCIGTLDDQRNISYDLFQGYCVHSKEFKEEIAPNLVPWQTELKAVHVRVNKRDIVSVPA